MIDNNKVCKLFNERARYYGKMDVLNIAMFQEHHGDLAQKRDKLEYDTVLSLIRPRLNKTVSVLDVACGTGRWAFHLAPLVGTVEGFDFSPALVDICKQEAQRLGMSNTTFQVRAIDDSAVSPTFDIVIISGVCLYTNDAQWANIYTNLLQWAHIGTQFIVREACGNAGRYEIHNRWSEELQIEYSAIYRDPDWFHGIFGTFCKCVHSAPLFPPELEKWKETHQRLFIFEAQRGCDALSQKE